MARTPLLYGITPEIKSTQELIQLTINAASAGIHWLQYRDKIRPKQEQIAIATELKAICANFRTKLIINDHIDICMASSANGVHLGQSDGSLLEARRQLGEQAIIGVTCHQSLKLIESAEQGGATYAALGACFPSSTKPDAPTTTLEQLQIICPLTQLPLVFIGGIKCKNVQSLLKLKPHAIAVSASIFHANDIADKVRQWLTLLGSLDTSSENIPK